MRRNWFCAKSATCWRGPIAPSTLPTQMRASRRRRQPRFVAGLQRQQQRRTVQRFGLAQRHADQRAVGADGQLEHFAVDAVGLARSSSACAPGSRPCRCRRAAACCRRSGSTAAHASSSARPIGIGANMRSGSSVATPDGRLALAATSRSLSRISGELPTMVSAAAHDDGGGNRHQQPRQADAGARRQARGDRQVQRHHRRVLHDRRVEAGDRRRSAAAGVCSMPCERRSSQPARRLSAPVRSRPVPRIIVAMTFITALRREAVEDVFRRDQSGQAEQHQHHQRDHVGAHALEQEQHHRAARPARARAPCRW